MDPVQTHSQNLFSLLESTEESKGNLKQNVLRLFQKNYISCLEITA